MGDRNYDFCDDPLSELVAADARIEELEDELAEAQSKILRWIPVGEILPEDGRKVLAFDEHLPIVQTARRHGSYWDCEGLDFLKPTHWMPLPEPPEVK